MLIDRTASLARVWPGLHAEIWHACVLFDAAHRLPPLHETASEADAGRRRAENMSAFFRALGARGRSPVEFQITKAAAGELDYSRRNTLVDFLLYAEVRTGLLIGFHDASLVSDGIELGLASDARELKYTHMSQREISLRPTEPVLIANRSIIGSLRHGPDYATRITPATKTVWAVVFASPEEVGDELTEAATMIRAAGVDLGIWSMEKSL
jgi:hypothetical protein